MLYSVMNLVIIIYYKHTESDFSTKSKVDFHCLDILYKLNISTKSLYKLHYKKYKQLISANKFSEQYIID